MKLVIISGGVSDPSSTGMLAGRLSQGVAAQARQRNLDITSQTIELRTLAKVVDESMRSLFTYLRALTVLAHSGVEAAIRDDSWGRYRHELGSNGGEELDSDLDASMMRLATGGSATTAPAPEA